MGLYHLMQQLCVHFIIFTATWPWLGGALCTPEVKVAPPAVPWSYPSAQGANKEGIASYPPPPERPT